MAVLLVRGLHLFLTPCQSWHWIVLVVRVRKDAWQKLLSIGAFSRRFAIAFLSWPDLANWLSVTTALCYYTSRLVADRLPLQISPTRRYDPIPLILLC